MNNIKDPKVVTSMLQLKTSYLHYFARPQNIYSLISNMKPEEN